MFISPAFADAAAAAPQEPSFLMSILPLLLIFALFYVLVLRPQSKRIRAHAEMQKAIQPGDQVVTGGGLFGTVVAVTEADITVEIAKGVTVRAQKHTISAIQEAPADAAKK